jgi:hypothetical protein
MAHGRKHHEVNTEVSGVDSRSDGLTSRSYSSGLHLCMILILRAENA